jgi:hypothetical protein
VPYKNGIIIMMITDTNKKLLNNIHFIVIYSPLC